MKKISKVLVIAGLAMSIAIPSSAATPEENITDSARSFFRDTLRVVAREKADSIENLGENFADNIKDLADSFADQF